MVTMQRFHGRRPPLLSGFLVALAALASLGLAACQDEQAAPSGGAMAPPVAPAESLTQPNAAEAPASAPMAPELPGVDAAIVAAARRGVGPMLARIPEGRETAFGFTSRADFTRTTLGRPYRVYTLRPTALKTAGRLSDSIEPLAQWRFPLLVDGRSAALLTVERMPDGWAAVDFGAAGLARELAAAENPADADSSPRGILRLYQLKADFLIRPRSYEEPAVRDVLPLTSARMALDEPDSTRGYVDLDTLQPALLKKLTTVEAVEPTP